MHEKCEEIEMKQDTSAIVKALNRIFWALCLIAGCLIGALAK